MLLLNLSRIRTAHERVEQVYEPGELGQTHDDFRVVAPTSLAFDISKDKQRFRLAGRVCSTLELSCGRCLEQLRWPVDAQFDLQYVPLGVNAGGEHEIADDDMTTAFYENEEIDLGQLMAEQFYLSLPMKPLCHEGCRGLCPDCGTNLNRGSCACERRWVDPRLAVLSALKKES